MEYLTEFRNPAFRFCDPRVVHYNSFQQLINSELVQLHASSDKFHRFSVKHISEQIVLVAEYDHGYYKRNVGICSSSLYLEELPSCSNIPVHFPARVIEHSERTIWPVRNLYPKETTIRIYDSDDSERIINDRTLIGSILCNSFSKPSTDPFWLWEKLNGNMCEFKLMSSKKNIGVQIVSVMNHDLSSLVVQS